MKEWLRDNLVPGSKALDIGSGSGYLCAAFYEMMDRDGKVVGVEHIEPLAEQSIINLKKSYNQPLNDQSILIISGDGRLGYDKLAPYDAIHVGAGKKIIYFFFLNFNEAADKVPKQLID